MLAIARALSIPVSTFQALPAPASFIGTIFVSNVGASGSFWRSNGTVWGLVGGSCVLQSSAVASSVTGTLVETTLATIPILGNLLGLNGSIEIEAKYTCTNSVNLKIFRVNYGGQVFNSAGLLTSLTNNFFSSFANRNSATSQIAENDNTGAAAWRAGTVNSVVDQNLTLTAILALVGETITLESYVVKLIRP